MTTKDEVRNLWKLCFDDSDAFVDLYFSLRYSEEVNRVVREDGKVVSALQALPYPLTFCDEVVPMAYVSGACTHPDYRGRGLMRRLLQLTHRRMFADGIGWASLIPAGDDLRIYYARSGYASGFGYTTCEVHREDVVQSNNVCSVEACLYPTDEVYRYFDVGLRRRPACVLHTLDDFDVIMADCRLGGGRLLVARCGRTIVGLAWVLPGSGGACVKELLADDGQARIALLDEAFRLFQVERLTVFKPDSSGGKTLGMARVIHVEALLSLLARKYPSLECCFRLESDEDLPANNGCYQLSAGTCRRVSVVADCPVHTPVTLAQWLLELERPYMSLMLD